MAKTKRAPKPQFRTVDTDGCYEIVGWFSGTRDYGQTLKVKPHDLAGNIGIRRHKKNETNRQHTGWYLDHIPTGMLITPVKTKAAAYECARRLLQVSDFNWTLPIPKGIGPACLDILRDYRQ